MNPYDIDEGLTFPLSFLTFVGFFVNCLDNKPTGWFTMTFGSDIHVSLGMNSNNFGDLLTFYLSSSQNSNLSNTVV